jgi:hypothetical protein
VAVLEAVSKAEPLLLNQHNEAVNRPEVPALVTNDKAETSVRIKEQLDQRCQLRGAIPSTPCEPTDSDAPAHLPITAVHNTCHRPRVHLAGNDCCSYSE